MNKHYFTVLFFCVLLALNMLIIHRGWNIASGYPFQRILLENKIHFTSVFSDIPEGYGGEIIEVNGQSFKNPRELLTMIAEKRVRTVTYKTGSFIRKRSFDGSSFNNDIFAFIIFILLCGNIHCIWGAVIRSINPDHETSKNFSYFSLGMGSYFLSLALFIVYHNSAALIAASALFIFFSIMKMSLMMSPIKKKSQMMGGLSLLVFILLSVSVYFSVLYSIADVIFLLNLLVVLSYIAAAVFIVMQLFKNKNISRQTAALLIVSGFISLCIPFTMIALSFKTDVHLPMSFYASLTIFMPMIIGNSIANENVRNTFALRRRYLFRIFFNIGVSLLFAVSVFIMLRSGIRNDLLFGIEVIMVTGFILLLFIRKEFISAIRLYNKSTRELYTRSLRKISEITASPGELHLRIESIFSIVKDITGLQDLIVELFEKEIIRKIDVIPGYLEYCADNRILQYVSEHHNVIYKNSLFTGCIYEYVNRDGALRSFAELVIPVESEGTVIGLLQAGSKTGDSPLTDEELRFLNSVSILLYQLIENEILYREYDEKRTYEKEIDIASYIQMRLFPKDTPSGHGISASHYSRPFMKVTGDYFDFFNIDENRTLLAIGDVAGHGLSAASILAVTGHIITACLDEGRDIEGILLELNDFFTIRYRGNEMMTLFMMVYDRKQGKAEYINAGHCMPLLLRNGKVIDDFFPARSQILGADSFTTFKISSVELIRNDEIMLFTDGIIEIQKDGTGNNIGDFFIIDVMKNNPAESIEGKIELIGRYLDKLPRNSIKDDITILGLQIE